MTRIVFDLQALQNGSRGRGIGRYVLHLFRALAAESRVELYGLINAGLTEHFHDASTTVRNIVGDEHLLIFEGIHPTREIEDENLERRLYTEAAYEEFLASLDFDTLLVGSLFEGFTDETNVSLKGSGYHKSVILYDLIPLVDPERFLGWDKTYRWYHSRLSHLAQADTLLAISKSARDEALDHLRWDPERIVAIGTATDPDIFHHRLARDSSILDRLGIDRSFLMHASAFEERKNFDGLIRAFAALPRELRDQYQVVLAGNANDEVRKHLQGIAESEGLRERDVVFTGYVSDSDLAQLYRHCTLFVFPSFHEGFGLPVLEAMSSGCPAIGSNRSSIPEVIGRADLLFDPADSDEMSALIARLLCNEAELKSAARHAVKQSKSFAWKKIASLARNAITAHGKRKRLPQLSLEDSVRQIARRRRGHRLEAADAQMLARALARNQQQAFAQVGRSAAASRPSWRIEGPFDSSYSLALLNRETARALNKLGYKVSLHSTEGPGDFDPNPTFLAANADLLNFHVQSQVVSEPDVVSRLLYPPRVYDMPGRVKALHHYAWEETGFPQEWVQSFNSSLTMMTCLSRHVQKIMVDNGVAVPLATSGCGVDHWERIEADSTYSLAAKTFRFLHVSSCFPRKGLDLLLEAYGTAFDCNDDVSLVIKTFDNPHNAVRSQLEEAQRTNWRFPHVELVFADLSDAELKALYGQCDVMVGPSCAEGYGLPFAEAMLSGLPVITTNWGGQLDFCNEGNSWLVDFEFERARTHFGVWSSAWARAKPSALTAAMQKAVNTPIELRREMANRGRRQLLDSHKWSDVALRLSAASAVLPRYERRAPKVGWMTTWGSRCGIASASAHLLEKFNLQTVVFAPSNEDHLADGAGVVRCWGLAKENATYDEIHKRCSEAGIGVLIIQFNYTFYDHRALAELIGKCRDDNIRVLIILHSTTDTPDPRVELFQLRYLRAGLAKCDRILVHSVADLNRLKLLGVVENVALFPLGTVECESPRLVRTNRVETVASYGFALPGKGLEQLLDAVGLLHQRGRMIRLRLVNAEYPLDVSREIIEKLRNRVVELSLSDWVEHDHEYLSDEESLRLLQDSDLAVFAYQGTGESASAAVRFGLAAQIPVAVTPIPIFDDLGEAVFRFDGTGPEQIADGIERLLDELRHPSSLVNSVAEAADRWRSQHSYASVATRLGNMCVALVNQASRT
ncbi:MAG: glycosyltransferase [Sphingomicrobium sp.]